MKDKFNLSAIARNMNQKARLFIRWKRSILSALSAQILPGDSKICSSHYWWRQWTLIHRVPS